MSFWSALYGLAAARPSWEQVSYPYLDTDEPAHHFVEVWPVGAVNWLCVGAYNPQNGPGGDNRSGNHVVLGQDFTHGRYTREQGRALCESPSKRFWDLSADRDRHMVSCKACQRLALTHGIDLAVRPLSIGAGDLWQRAPGGTSATFLVEDMGASRWGTTLSGRLTTEHGQCQRTLQASDFVDLWRLVHRRGLVVNPRSDGGRRLYHRSFTDARG